MALLRKLSLAAMMWARSESLSLSWMGRDEPDLASACETPNLSLRKLLRYAHFYCTGVEKYWNGAQCGCAIRRVRNETMGFMEKAALDVLEADLKVNPSVASTTIVDTGGTRVYLPECQRDENTRVPSLFYRSTRRGEGDMIKKTLQRVNGMKDETIEEGFWTKFKLCDVLTTKRTAARDKPGAPVLFTFVRDPVEHFLEVYSEASASGAFVLSADVSPSPLHAAAHVGSPEHFLHFVAFILNGGRIEGTPLLQAQALQEERCTSQFDFIGKAEFASYDWQALASRMGCESSMFDSVAANAMQQAESADYSAIKAFLTWNDGAMQKVLCWLLLPDYAVFDYPVPQACQTGDFAQIF